jgi:ADP-L-glycero-D-manno-heptose 6-epimerase
MIVITGAAGFISSCLAGYFNQKNENNLVLVDDFSKLDKKKNFETKNYKHLIERGIFIDWFSKNASDVSLVIHLGARTDTTEFDFELLEKLNTQYTKDVWKICTEKQIPLIYASSAATYGLGEFGYEDNHEVVNNLKPLNPYGISKNDFDIWAIQQKNTPPNWYGLKFFNVYGPNEYHKGRMASVIFHSYHQIKKNSEVKLFRSHNPNYSDGGQLRDFVYVKDVLKVIDFLKNNFPKSGLYNLGSGRARTFFDLASNTFKALGKTPNISFIDTPIDIRDKYQYFTEANMAKLKSVGYSEKFYSLEEGVEDYVKNYLESESYL